MSGFFKYLADFDRLLSSKCAATTVDEFLDLDILERTLATRAAIYIKQTMEVMESSKADSKAKMNEIFALEIDKMTTMHMIYYMFHMTRERITKYDFKDAKIRPILEIVLKVFAVKQLTTETRGLYECGYFDSGSGKLLDDAFKKLLIDLRPHMIPLAESMKMIDEVTPWSTIGNKYGDIYDT